MKAMNEEAFLVRVRSRHGLRVAEQVPARIRQFCTEHQVEEELPGRRWRIRNEWTSRGRLVASAETNAYLATGVIRDTLILQVPED